MAGLTITNPLALHSGSFTIGSSSTPAGYSNTGTLLPGIVAQANSSPAPSSPTRAPSPGPTPTPTPDPQNPGNQTNGTGSGTTTGPSAIQLADYNNLKNSTLNSITDAITNGGTGYNSSNQDYLDGRVRQQNTIDSDSVQNELAREQGYQGVLDMVGNGIRSGGVILANDNAGTSSAGEALARAYGIMGRQEMSKVGNQAAQGQNKIDTEEANLVAGDATQLRHAQENKANIITSIVNNARQQLGYLNQSAAYASLPDRVDIEAKIAEVKQQAMDALSAFDNHLSSGIATNTPMNSDAVRAKATSLLTAGVAPEQQFDYTDQIPAEFQGTGQFASDLPIFLNPSAKKQMA